MRIRFVTKAHVQVLQASRMEKHTIPDGPIPLYGLSPLVVCRQWGSQLVALNGMTQSFALPVHISYAMAAVMTMRSGDFPGFVACPYWTECTTDTIMITPDYETGQRYDGTGKSTVTWILLSI